MTINNGFPGPQRPAAFLSLFAAHEFFASSSVVVSLLQLMGLLSVLRKHCRCYTHTLLGIDRPQTPVRQSSLVYSRPPTSLSGRIDRRAHTDRAHQSASWTLNEILRLQRQLHDLAAVCLQSGPGSNSLPVIPFPATKRKKRSARRSYP